MFKGTKNINLGLLKSSRNEFLKQNTLLIKYLKFNNDKILLISSTHIFKKQ